LIGKNQDMLSQVAQEIKTNYPVQVTAVSLDLSQPNLVEGWLAQQNLPDVDLIINNAAWAEGGCFADVDLADYRSALETNFFAPLKVSKKYLTNMLKKKHGAIINIVTSGARCTLPFFSAYASSKAALWSWSEALSRELNGTGVHVMTFIPPNMSTAINKRLGRKALAFFKINNILTSPVELEQIAEEVIESLMRNKRYIAPMTVKIKIALNSLFHHLVTKRILRFWKT
jgi:uncharacterized protein